MVGPPVTEMWVLMLLKFLLDLPHFKKLFGAWENFQIPIRMNVCDGFVKLC